MCAARVRDVGRRAWPGWLDAARWRLSRWRNSGAPTRVSGSAATSARVRFRRDGSRGSRRRRLQGGAARVRDVGRRAWPGWLDAARWRLSFWRNSGTPTRVSGSAARSGRRGRARLRCRRNCGKDCRAASSSRRDGLRGSRRRQSVRAVRLRNVGCGRSRTSTARAGRKLSMAGSPATGPLRRARVRCRRDRSRGSRTLRSVRAARWRKLRSVVTWPPWSCSRPLAGWPDAGGWRRTFYGRVPRDRRCWRGCFPSRRTAPSTRSRCSWPSSWVDLTSMRSIAGT